MSLRPVSCHSYIKLNGYTILPVSIKGCKLPAVRTVHVTPFKTDFVSLVNPKRKHPTTIHMYRQIAKHITDRLDPELHMVFSLYGFDHLLEDGNITRVTSNMVLIPHRPIATFSRPEEVQYGGVLNASLCVCVGSNKTTVPRGDNCTADAAFHRLTNSMECSVGCTVN